MNEDMMTVEEREPLPSAEKPVAEEATGGAAEAADSAEGSTAKAGRGKGLYYVHTLGCQMNVHDSERIAGVLESDGYVKANQVQIDSHDLDLIVMNTCAVRENASNRMYGTLGQWAELKRENPRLQIAVGGCMAQKDRQRITERAPWVDAVFGTKNIGSLTGLLDKARAERRSQVQVATDLDYFPSQLPVSRASRVSAWVAISMGCNNTCTFCTSHPCADVRGTAARATSWMRSSGAWTQDPKR